MSENEQEFGLEISLTMYDEGFETYQQSGRQDKDRLVDKTVKKEQRKKTMKEQSSDTKANPRYLENPSLSSDSTNDGTVSTTSEASFSDDNERNESIPSIDVSSLSAVSSSELLEDEVASLTISNKYHHHPNLPTHKEEKEEEKQDEQDMNARDRDVVKQNDNDKEAIFFARMDASRAYMATFPTTVKKLKAKTVDLLEALHAKDKRCNAAEAELALVKYEACLQSEEYRILYGRAKEEQVLAVHQAGEMAKDCTAKIADLAAERDALARSKQELEAVRTAQDEQIRLLRDALAASQAEASQRQQEKAQQATEMETLRVANEQSTNEFQEALYVNRNQLANLTATVEEERRQHQQLQTSYEATIKQIETLKTELIQVNSDRETMQTALAVQMQSVEQLTTEVRQWKDRAYQLVAETTCLSRENARLAANQEHVATRARAELDQAHSVLKSSQAHWEAKVAAALLTTERVQAQLEEGQKRTEELTADLLEWKIRADGVKNAKLQADEEREKVVCLTEKLEAQEQQLQALRNHAKTLNSKMQRLQGKRDELSLELQRSHDRNKFLEDSTADLQRQLSKVLDQTVAAETKVGVAYQEASVAKSMTARLKDKAKRRREILVQHRNKIPSYH